MNNKGEQISKLKKEIEKEDKYNKIPFGLKVISAWYYFLASLLLSLTIYYLLKSIRYSSIYGNSTLMFDIIVMLVVLIFVFILFFIARGLWKGKNWSRIVIIILSTFFIVFSSILTLVWVFIFVPEDNLATLGMISIAGGAVFIINIIILGYLFLSKNVKEFFKK